MLKDSLKTIKSIYLLPEDNLAQEVLVPAFKSSKDVKIVMGYFSSASLKEIADGLVTFLNESEGKITLIMSPFFTTTDRAIIEMTDEEKIEFVESSMFEISLGEDNLVALSDVRAYGSK